MAYHQGLYLFLFLPLVVLVYALVPRKIRRAVLILAGYVFFWSFSRWLVVYLIGVTTLIYGIGCRMEYLKAEGKKKAKEQESKKSVWSGIARKLPSAFFLRKCFGILEKMAHYSGCMAQSVCILPGVRLRDRKKWNHFGREYAGKYLTKMGIFLKERGMLNWSKLQQMKVPSRWLLYYVLIFAVILFGAYGTGYQQVDLIYAGF